MAFGVNRAELTAWKNAVKNGEIAFLTHYWLDDRFPECHSITKVGCNDLEKLINWGKAYKLKKEWIHQHPKFPHFDLFGTIQKQILIKEKQWKQIKRFDL